MWARLPAGLLTRRIYVVVLILPGLILLHVLLQTSQISLADSYKAQFLRPHRDDDAIDDRVGWHINGDSNAPTRDSIPGLGSSKTGSSWTDIGRKLGKLTGVSAGRRPSTHNNAASSQSFTFKRSGGSIYEVSLVSFTCQARGGAWSIRANLTSSISPLCSSPIRVL